MRCVTKQRPFPGPFLGSGMPARPLPAGPACPGPGAPLIAGLSPAMRCATGGDVNPDRLTPRFYARMSFGWPRRWPPASSVPALVLSHGFILTEAGSVSGAFSAFADHFRSVLHLVLPKLQPGHG